MNIFTTAFCYHFLIICWTKTSVIKNNKLCPLEMIFIEDLHVPPGVNRQYNYLYIMGFLVY